jgi:hypothetical protein
VSIDPSFRAKQSRYELFGRHLQTEYADDIPVFGRVLSHIQSKGGLAHRRPSRDHDQLLPLQPASFDQNL